MAIIFQLRCMILKFPAADSPHSSYSVEVESRTVTCDVSNSREHFMVRKCAQLVISKHFHQLNACLNSLGAI